MTIRSFALAAIAALTIGMPVTQASARTSATLAPIGYQILCMTTPSACKGSRQTSTTFSVALMTTLKRVNVTVNRRIKPRNDPRGTDNWSLNVAYGDCEDYALAKRAALIRAGVPAGAVRIATARTRSGAGHAVLIIKTSRGDLVLDNRTNSIKSKRSSGLRFIAISGGTNPRVWASL